MWWLPVGGRCWNDLCRGVVWRWHGACLLCVGWSVYGWEHLCVCVWVCRFSSIPHSVLILMLCTSASPPPTPTHVRRQMSYTAEFPLHASLPPSHPLPFLHIHHVLALLDTSEGELWGCCSCILRKDRYTQQRVSLLRSPCYLGRERKALSIHSTKIKWDWGREQCQGSVRSTNK